MKFILITEVKVWRKNVYAVSTKYNINDENLIELKKIHVGQILSFTPLIKTLHSTCLNVTFINYYFRFKFFFYEL